MKNNYTKLDSRLKLEVNTTCKLEVNTTCGTTVIMN